MSPTIRAFSVFLNTTVNPNAAGQYLCCQVMYWKKTFSLKCIGLITQQMTGREAQRVCNVIYAYLVWWFVKTIAAQCRKRCVHSLKGVISRHS